MIKYMILGAVAMCAACTGYTDEEITIRADKSTIIADGQEAVSFTVDLDGRDVTAESVITNAFTGEIVPGGIFTTSTPGVYTFTARYSDIPAVLPVTVTATAPALPPPDDPGSGRFYRRVGILEFTGTWCAYCPDMAGHINGAGALYPDRHVMLAVHAQDNLTVPFAQTLIGMLKISALPAAVIDLDAQVNNTNTSASDLALRMREIVEAGPAGCGLSISSAVTGNTASVTVRLRAAETRNFGIAVALAEDGITGYPQTMPDASIQRNYVHDHTLRKFHGDTVDGVQVGEVAAETQVERTFSFDLAGYVAGNCRIVAFATSTADGKTVMINAAECPLGGSVGFQYESE